MRDKITKHAPLPDEQTSCSLILFTLSLYSNLKKLSTKIRGWSDALGPEEIDEITLEHESSLSSFYLDDGVFTGRHEILHRSMVLLNSQEARGHGLHFCMRNCTLWWPTEMKPGYPGSLAYTTKLDIDMLN